VSAILKQQKRKHQKVVVDALKGVPPPPAGTFLPGSRPDNEWIMYNSEKLPDSQEKWEAMEFVDKTHWGYYCWPKYDVCCSCTCVVKLNSASSWQLFDSLCFICRFIESIF
jgi:hypothetical protein